MGHMVGQWKFWEGKWYVQGKAFVRAQLGVQAFGAPRCSFLSEPHHPFFSLAALSIPWPSATLSSSSPALQLSEFWYFQPKPLLGFPISPWSLAWKYPSGLWVVGHEKHWDPQVPAQANRTSFWFSPPTLCPLLQISLQSPITAIWNMRPCPWK